MPIEDMISELQAIAAEHPGLRVKFRQSNGYLAICDEITVERNSFETWAEVG